MNLVETTEALAKAEGSSQRVIVAFFDIRGFSAFSRVNESPNIALYVKKLFLKVLKDYFPGAAYAKPTGDGLLLVFPHDEDELAAIANEVVAQSIRCVDDFKDICSSDPILNFALPSLSGIGIARGLACRLHSAGKTIDYSGHLLNLAARLNDLARPSGVVLDRSFLDHGVLVPAMTSAFGVDSVYLRGVAESEPVEVCYQISRVEISARSKVPISGPNWASAEHTFTVGNLKKLGPRWLLELPSPAEDPENISVSVVYPKVSVPNVFTEFAIKDSEYIAEPNPCIRIQLDTLRARLPANLSARKRIKVLVKFKAAK